MTGGSRLRQLKLVSAIDRRNAVDWIRAGALTAGVATLLGVWWKGLDRLGYLEWPAGFDATFIVSIALASAAGATLGHRPEANRPLVWRLIAALVVGIAFGAALIGLSFLLVTKLGVAERNLPPVFVVMGVGLIAWGLRSLPRSVGARVVMVAGIVLLLAIRLLATFPQVAHAIEQRLFPLPPAEVRSAWEQRGCGNLCDEGRTRVVDFQHEVDYESEEHQHLSALAHVRPTLETTRAFFVDGCGWARNEKPAVPEELRGYPTTAACKAARPRPRLGQMMEPYDTRCCYIDNRQRQAGERIVLPRTLRFSFVRLRWQPTGDASSHERRRPGRPQPSPP